MNEQQKKRKTAIDCIKEIVKLLPGGINLKAFLENRDDIEDFDLIFDVAKKLKLSPEINSECNMDELSTYFGAPVFLELKNGNFVLFLGSRKQQKRFRYHSGNSKGADRKVRHYNKVQF